MNKSKRYIVFERPEGSKCWTMAHKYVPECGSEIGASFLHHESAETWVRDVHSKTMGWRGGKPNQVPMQSHIAVVELPE